MMNPNSLPTQSNASNQEELQAAVNIVTNSPTIESYPEIKKGAKITGILTLVVSVLNLLAIGVLFVLFELQSSSQIFLAVSSFLLILLLIAGVIILTTKSVVKVRNYSKSIALVVALSAVLSLISGAGAIGVLPIVVFVYAMKTNKATKGINS